MKIKFGDSKPNVLHNWEIYSPNQPIHIKQKYWQNYDVAVSYAKILNAKFGGAFAVRWCKPYPQKPVRLL